MVLGRKTSGSVRCLPGGQSWYPDVAHNLFYVKTVMAYVVVTCQVPTNLGENTGEWLPPWFRALSAAAAPVLPREQAPVRGEPGCRAQCLLAEPPAAFLGVSCSRKQCCSRQLERPPGLWDLSCKRNVCNKFSFKSRKCCYPCERERDVERERVRVFVSVCF